MKRTLNSIIHQEIKPKFHIFVDLASNDATKDIVEEYIKYNKTTKIYFLNQSSKGIYSAWNQGLSHLLEIVDKNHFITILNSDDWLDKNCTANVSNHIDYDLVAGSCIVHYEKKSFLRPCRNLRLLPIFMSIIDPSLFIKASVFRNIGIYKERYAVAADHEFVFRAYEMGYKFKILKDVLVNIKMGGFAYQNKEKAFLEQLELGRERCLLPIPELAYIYRSLRFPRFRFFDFL